MKILAQKTLWIVLMLFTLCQGQACAENDKYLHMSISGIGSLAIMSFLEHREYTRTESVLISVGMMLGAGLVKELVIDKKFDGQDMLANTMGCSGATFLFISF